MVLVPLSRILTIGQPVNHRTELGLDIPFLALLFEVRSMVVLVPPHGSVSPQLQ